MKNHYFPIRIAIVDDHEVYRDGIKLLLSDQPGMEVVAEAENGRQLLQLLATREVDVVLADIMMPVMDGIALTRCLGEQHPAISVIALSMFNEDNLIVDMLEAGARGYLVKNARKAEILEAITTVNGHRPYYCRSTSQKLTRLIAASRFNPYERADQPSFSEKEIQVMRLICQELNNKEIGDRLYLSVRTVEGYRTRLFEKTGAHTGVGLAIYAIKHGIFKIDGKA